MKLLKIQENIEYPTNRAFGFVIGSIFFIFALIKYFKEGLILKSPLSIGGVIFLIAALYPIWLERLKIFWINLTLPLSKIINFILMVFIYFFVITPIAILMRLLGRDPLFLKRKLKKETYWIEKIPTRKTKEQLKLQF